MRCPVPTVERPPKVSPPPEAPGVQLPSVELPEVRAEVQVPSVESVTDDVHDILP